MNKKDPRPWFRVEAKAELEDAPTSADVYIYDEIGESWWGGIAPKALIDEITALDVDDLNVYINSPGGAAWDGIAIMNALRRHKAKVHVTVDALAASAASMIAMAGDRITMNRGGQLMIHDASGGVYGNAKFLEETAEILHKLSNSYADTYAARAGGSRESWRALMEAETWYTAEEAVEAGLADDWVDAPSDATAEFDLSRFKFRGRASAPAPAARADLSAIRSSETSPAAPVGNTSKGYAMAFLDEMAALLGASEATEDAIRAAAEEVVTRPEATAVPEGAIVVDRGAYEALQGDATAGRQAMDAINAQRRDGIVAAALTEGRIAASAKDSWRAQLDKDEEGISKLLASFPKNTVPVAEIGHSDQLTSSEDALYEAWTGEKEN